MPEWHRMAYSHAFFVIFELVFGMHFFYKMQTPARKIIQHKQTIRISNIYNRIGSTLL